MFEKIVAGTVIDLIAEVEETWPHNGLAVEDPWIGNTVQQALKDHATGGEAEVTSLSVQFVDATDATLARPWIGELPRNASAHEQCMHCEDLHVQTSISALVVNAGSMLVSIPLCPGCRTLYDARFGGLVWL